MSFPRAVNHPALLAYLQRLLPGMPADRRGRPDGAVALVFAEGLRVTFHPVGQGDLVLEARIAELSGRSRTDIDELCRQAIELAGQRPWSAVDNIALSPDGAALLLQQWVSALCPLRGLEQQVDDFLSALMSWRRAMGLETA